MGRQAGIAGIHGTSWTNVAVKVQTSVMNIQTYADLRHRKQVIALWKAVFGYEAIHNEPGLVIDKKIAVDDLFYVAVNEGIVLGTIMGGYDGHRGWIYSVAVHPDNRKQGVGTELLNHVQERLASLGCIKVNIQIVEGNGDVQTFYRANGFAVEERISMGKHLPEE